MEKLAIPDMKSLERWYIRVLNEQLSKESSHQQFWLKAISVGYKEWLKATAIEMGIKRYKIFEHKKSKINFSGGALLF